MTDTDESLKPYDVWLRDHHLSQATGLRYRKRGWMETVRVGNRVYVTATAVATFNRRAATGEFARQRPARSDERKKT